MPRSGSRRFAHTVREDGELGEDVVFEVDGAGQVLRVRCHGNAMEKMP